MAGVIRSDRLFTLLAVAVISHSGAMAARAGGSGLLRSGWLAWGVGLFLLSGLAFMALVPLQRQLHDQAARPAAHWPDCTRLLRRWNVIGLISLVPAWAALALMVLKLPR